MNFKSYLKEPKKAALLIGGVAALILGTIFVLVKVPGMIKTLNKETSDKIEISKNGEKVTVTRDGAARWETEDGVFTETWEKAKTDAFFNYFEDKYLGAESFGESDNRIVFDGGESVNLSDDDELADVITGGGGGGGGEDGVSDYFENPPTSPPGGGGTWLTPTPRPTNPPTVGEESECRYWRLSYCVMWPSPPPPPTAAPTPGSTIAPPTCTELLNKTTGRTVITNELCVATPAPTPTLTPTPLPTSTPTPAP